ncbi:transaldolase [Campylobacter blaseri]|uniref:Transaldolase n=1 Tax=Campylobacter blaseri TaxID=2042961 RepID=A0A2P8R148_9BACT|nr:transaldolase [Campylobacter blaseri]PSM52227.1 transaldolase [Campylobacter blaseri]PSM53993.1 transaldolase [Campylobacter blaseri]QKF85430.1 transaldolase [Campylobacter blaseri]
MYNGNFSLWCDFLERDFIDSEFKNFVKDEIFNGATSNPAIFKNAILNSKAYDKYKNDFKDKSPKEIYELMATKDIKNAATILLKNYENSDDGFVSLEVDPELCNDANATYNEGIRLFESINMPNVMIKVPATKEGYVAMEKLIAKGVNVNATLIFSPEQTQECLLALQNGTKTFKNTHSEQKLPQAVISVFVSRFDRLLDEEMVKNGFKAGRIGIMNASKCYNLIQKTNQCNVRALFASTGVKGASLEPSYYVSELMYKNSINTAPLDTIKEFIKIDNKLKQPYSDSQIDAFFEKIGSSIDMDKAYAFLLEDGLKQFKIAFQEILKSLK